MGTPGHRLLAGAALLAGIALWGCAGSPRRLAPPAPFTAQAAALLDRNGFQTARLGLVALDLETGETLCDLDGHRAFLPASTLKLFTAALALARLGPSWQARTTLYRRGEIRGPLLEGDLILRGGGDPALGMEEDPFGAFRAWGESLYAGGLRTVAGDVVGDGTLFADPGLGEGWAWDDLGEPWSAPFGALVWHGSVVELRIQPAGEGLAPRILQVPAVAGALEVVNLCLCRREGEGALTLGRRETPPAVVLSGLLPAQGPPLARTCPVFRPALFAAQALKQALEASGIQVRGRAREVDPAGEPAWERSETTRLAERASAPLPHLLARVLQESHNLTAEMLFRLAGLAGGGEQGRATAGAAREELGRLLGELGVEAEGLVAADGSGLSRLSQVTPRQLAGLLAGAWRQGWGRFLVQALPRAGLEGTLADRFRGTVLEGAVRAKTGTLTRVFALAGYQLRTGRAPLVFACLAQGFTAGQGRARAELDALLERLATGAGR